MKKLFLGAVVISALCSSCETADDIYEKETKHETRTTSAYKSTSDNYEHYRSIVDGFTYDQNLNYRSNIQLFEQYVNRYIQQDLDDALYQPIDWEKLNQLCYADESFIKQLDYSDAFKESLQAILQGKNASIPKLTIATEEQIAATMLKMHHDYMENGGDDKWGGNRIIAYAYGTQYNYTQAVLYAGAIELKEAHAQQK